MERYRGQSKDTLFNICFSLLTAALVILVCMGCYLSGYHEGLNKGYENAMMEFVAETAVAIEKTTDEVSIIEEPIEELAEEEPLVEATVNVAYDWEYLLSIIAMESGNDDETTKGVCMCIRNACKDTLLNPCEVLSKYQYTTIGKTPSDSTRKIAEDVFINDVVYEEFGDADVFYSTSGGFVSSWHEKQNFICQVGVTKFFAMNTN